MTDPELRGLLAAAVETARDDYREALASTIQGQDNLPVWERLRRNLGDVILLAYLMGAERATVTLEKAEKALFSKHKIKYSDCGAGGKGGAGFQPGNTCAGEAGPTATPEFKSWFGDSRVVDDNNEPLVMYHGTLTGGFESFDPDLRGTRTMGEFHESRAFHFTENIETAEAYAELYGDYGPLEVFDYLENGEPKQIVRGGKPPRPGQEIMKVYLSIQNPMVFHGLRGGITKETIDKAKAAGHDGIIIYVDDGSMYDVAVFDPTQIKSSTGNDGSFDPDNPKITQSKFARTDLETEGIDELFLSTTFEAGPFQEGIADLTGRVALTREAVDELASLSRGVAQDILSDERANIVDRLDGVSRGISEGLRKAFWVSDVDPDTVVVIQDIIADALRGEMPGAEVSLPDFIDEARLVGIQNLTDARLETVFRTNVSTAFNEGRMEILRTPESRDLFPLVEIMEVIDDRTRPTHAIMDGYITTPAEMDRLFLRPPNGFNCRGTFNEITFDEAMDSGWILDDGTPDMQAIQLHNGAQREALVRGGRYPDPGFQKGMMR